MYYFSVPDSHRNFKFNIAFFSFMKKYEEWFYDDFQIKSAYGCPDHCIWNGNRSFMEKTFVDPLMYKRKVADGYKKNGIAYRLIFTNFMLGKEHYSDAYANALCRAFNEERTEVMVSTPEMVAYLHEHYPNLVCNWSTTTDFGSPYDFEGQIEKINELSKDAVVVLPYTLNNQFELLKKLCHPENIEVLVDEKCMSNCPRRREHEINSCLCNLYLKPYADTVCLMVPVSDIDGIETNRISRNNLSKYTDLGISLFKIEGRDNGIERLFISYLAYFIKKEFHEECINEVIRIAKQDYDYLIERDKIQDEEIAKLC